MVLILDYFKKYFNMLSLNRRYAMKKARVVFSTKPTVKEWFSDKIIRVVEKAKKVYGIDMGQVIVKRPDGVLFSAIIIPMKKIPVGSAVKVTEVICMYHGTVRAKFLVVQ
ncbi:MAG: hypothetical protein NTX55_02405 [Candidatus Parcubacteria bacterium]|nr:hypothetical protein [Candidatus Parcubacteria bacterium]